MRQRCLSPTNQQFANYGGRGIRVCREWATFDQFIADMGRRPSPSHSIDRVNNDGHYEPGNCRWATSLEQGTHTRRTRTATHNGETYHWSEWERRFRLPPGTLRHRLGLGWSFERATTTPIRPHQRHS
jgi:hypothetical protein